MNVRPAVHTSLGGSHQRRLVAGLCAAVILLAALLLSISSSALAASTFPDVPATHPYYDAITNLASRGIIGGYTNGNFGPGDLVKRQQFAKMAVLSGGYPVSESDVCLFTDVEKSGASSLYPDNYVAVCAASGITLGKTPSTFDPYAYITRYQVISMVVRMADNLQPGLLATPPPGWSENVTWATDPTHGANAVRAQYNGLLAGLDLSALGPYGNMTRGEVAQVLHNLLGMLMQPLFSDDFSTKAGGWYEDKSDTREWKVDTVLSRYTLTFFQPNRTLSTARGDNYDDFTVEVDGCCTSSQYEGRYGLVFRIASGWSDYYAFWVSNEGYWRFWHRKDGKWYYIGPQSDNPSSAIKTGTAWNNLKVTVQGSQVDLYINNVNVYTGTGINQLSSQIGVSGQAGGDAPVTLAFDNYKIWAVP